MKLLVILVVCCVLNSFSQTTNTVVFEKIGTEKRITLTTPVLVETKQNNDKSEYILFASFKRGLIMGFIDAETKQKMDKAGIKSVDITTPQIDTLTFADLAYLSVHSSNISGGHYKAMRYITFGLFVGLALTSPLYISADDSYAKRIMYATPMLISGGYFMATIRKKISPKKWQITDLD